MLSKDKVGLCLAGCGNFAHTHAEAAVQRSENVDLYFASRSADKGCAYAQQYSAAGAFGSYEEAARDPRVDAFLFYTPHALHRLHFDLAVVHGKHVMMEKPIATSLIATSLEDARTMQLRAQEVGIRFAVAENYRYMPTLRTAAELIQQGIIGGLRALHLYLKEFLDNLGIPLHPHVTDVARQTRPFRVIGIGLLPGIERRVIRQFPQGKVMGAATQKNIAGKEPFQFHLGEYLGVMLHKTLIDVSDLALGHSGLWIEFDEIVHHGPVPPCG